MGSARDEEDGGSMSGDTKHGPNCSDKIGRRKFIGAAAAAAGIVFIKPELVRGTAANSAVRVGLLGCAGRGTEDATNLIDTGGARRFVSGSARQGAGELQQDSAGERLCGDRRSAAFRGAECLATDGGLQRSRRGSDCHASVLSSPTSGSCGRSAKARLLRETGGGGCAGSFKDDRNREARGREAES